MNDYQDKGLATELRLGVKRWGGDAATRYSWKYDTYNSGGDWYFENFAYDDSNVVESPAGSTFDQFVDKNLRAGVQTLGTIPIIGMSPKSRDHTCSFSVAKYGPQLKTNPYDSDCGIGLKPDGMTPIVNDPSDTSVPVDPSFMQEWMAH